LPRARPTIFLNHRNARRKKNKGLHASRSLCAPSPGEGGSPHGAEDCLYSTWTSKPGATGEGWARGGTGDEFARGSWCPGGDLRINPAGRSRYRHNVGRVYFGARVQSRFCVGAAFRRLRGSEGSSVAWVFRPARLEPRAQAEKACIARNEIIPFSSTITRRLPFDAYSRRPAGEVLEMNRGRRGAWPCFHARQNMGKWPRQRSPSAADIRFRGALNVDEFVNAPPLRRTDVRPTSDYVGLHLAKCFMGIWPVSEGSVGTSRGWGPAGQRGPAGIASMLRSSVGSATLLGRSQPFRAGPRCRRARGYFWSTRPVFLCGWRGQSARAQELYTAGIDHRVSRSDEVGAGEVRSAILGVRRGFSTRFRGRVYGPTAPDSPFSARIPLERPGAASNDCRRQHDDWPEARNIAR